MPAGTGQITHRFAVLADRPSSLAVQNRSEATALACPVLGSGRQSLRSCSEPDCHKQQEEALESASSLREILMSKPNSFSERLLHQSLLLPSDLQHYS
jgi:hypothetical protein